MMDPEEVKKATDGPVESGESAAEFEVKDEAVEPAAVGEAAEVAPALVEVAGPTPEEIEAERVAARKAVLASSRQHTRRSFLVAAAAAAGGYGFFRWVEGGPEDFRQPVPLRRALDADAAISRGVFRDRAMAPTYPLSKAENLRVNGVYGLRMELVPESYRLQMVGTRKSEGHPRFAKDVTAWEYRYSEEKSKEDQGHDTKVDPGANTARKMAPADMVEGEERRQNNTVRLKRMPPGQEKRGQEEAGMSRSTLMPGTSGLLLTMEDVLKLPKYAMVTQFKCIEGWSQIVQWGGVRLADLIEAYPPALIDGREPKYVYMETPNGDYYVGYDLAVCRHPQSLLVTEMMGAPLTQFHGAPLRVHMPMKYGYKQIKRIGLIRYMNERPDDYWTKLGYDWFAGL